MTTEGLNHTLNPAAALSGVARGVRRGASAMRYGMFFGVAMLSAIISGNASALSKQQCSDANSQAPHGGEGGYEKLGKSFVLYQGSFYYEGSHHAVTLVRCSDGGTLTAGYSEKPDENQNDLSGNSFEEMRQVIKTMFDAPEVYSIADIGDALEKKGYWFRVTFEEKEECACKLFYPNERNGKVPFQLPDYLDDPSARELR
jgi:hypothetical protein